VRRNWGEGVKEQMSAYEMFLDIQPNDFFFVQFLALGNNRLCSIPLKRIRAVIF
jgi:hypothetical protein